MGKPVLCTYEAIVPKRVPYRLFWPVVGVVAFIVGNWLIQAFGGSRFLWTQLLFAGASAIGPLVMIWISHRFQDSLRSISPLLWSNEAQFEKWLEARATRTFTFSSWHSRLITGAIVGLALITVIRLGLPFDSGILNILALIGFAGLLIICGQAAYIVIDLLLALREIVRFPPKEPFNASHKHAIYELLNLYSIFAVLLTIGYVCLIMAIWQGPYPIGLEMQIWLSVLAFFPLSMFAWSFYQIHILLRNIKHSRIEIISKAMQETLDQFLKSKGEGQDADRLEKILNIEGRIQSEREWPFDLQSLLSFLIVLITAAVQVTITALTALQP